MLAIKGKHVSVIQSLLQRPQLAINQADNVLRPLFLLYSQFSSLHIS